MNSPEIIHACRWLIRDTFRQARASGVFWVMLAVSAVVILFCLSVSIQGGEPLDPVEKFEIKRNPGQISLAFGSWQLPLGRDAQSNVRYLLLLLAEWVAGAGGILLALVWTAGFIPDFLQPASATVLLSKPTPRWVLLLGKYLGVLAFVGFQVAVFILGTWLAIGLRTGVWANAYLWGIPLLLLQFAAFFSFSTFLAVWLRSTLVCVFGSVLFYLLCWGMNYGRHALLALRDDLPRQGPALRGLTETAYWILPKPIDLGMLLHGALEAGSSFGELRELTRVRDLGAVDPWLSLLSALAFAVCMIAIAARQLGSTDY